MLKRKIKYMSIFFICLIFIFFILNNKKIDKVNFSDTIITTDIDKNEKAQLNLVKRLEQQINQINGVKCSKISVNNEENILDVEIILSTHITPTDDMENNIISILKNSSTYDEISISWSLNDTDT